MANGPEDRREGDDGASLHVKILGNEIDIRRYDLIKLVGFIAFFACTGMLATIGYALYAHMEETKQLRKEEIESRRETAREAAQAARDAASETASAIRDFATSQRDLGQSVRMQTCVMSAPQEKRLEEVIKENSYCNRLTK
jgi:hypothetical protein